MALSVLGAPAAAEAASVTYSQFFPGTNNPDPAQGTPTFVPTDWNGSGQSVALPQFDPTLGTLTGVTLSLYGNINSSGTLDNTGSTAVVVSSYLATLDITLLAPGTVVPWDSTGGGDLLTVSPQLFNITTPLTIDAGQSYAFSTSAPLDAAASGPVAVASTAFAPYVGTGSVDFPLYTETSSTTDTSGGDLRISQATLARAEATVTYTYDLVATNVPEPASSALLGAGLLCLGVLRRRG
jgi:hypothetical protein